MLAHFAFIRPGVGEWIVILIIVLLIFGSKRLPGLGEALGKTIKGFRKAMSGNEKDGSDTKKDEMEKKD